MPFRTDAARGEAIPASQVIASPALFVPFRIDAARGEAIPSQRATHRPVIEKTALAGEVHRGRGLLRRSAGKAAVVLDAQGNAFAMTCS